jgi:sigma-E factor negative regulatory protein RseA
VTPLLCFNPRQCGGDVMLDRSEQKAQSLQNLSALADGELDSASTILACTHWRGDDQARTSWYAYHLIGDVMRSDDLASDAARDAAFLCTLRERLAAEPAVIALPRAAARPTPPQAPAVRSGSRWSWMASAAVVAGFMAVASALVLNRGGAPLSAPGDSLAKSFADKGAALAEVSPQQASASIVSADDSGDPLMLLADGKLVRDVRLERYFVAHKQFGGSSALGVPSGFLRAATTQTPDR